ncbi:MAG: hypothetical protein JW983_00795 [Elusimicrobia bacterium]|nr:hypothetical protein [Elusimicrobiota bacterium]
MKREKYHILNSGFKRLLVLTSLFSLLSSLCLHGAFKDSGWGVRPAGMGGAFCAVSNDANAPLYNPAGMSQIERKQATLMYAKPYWGLDIGDADLSLNFLSCIYPVEDIGVFGTGVTYFSDGLTYDEIAVFVSGAKNMNDIFSNFKHEISLGINLKYLYHAYDLDARTLNDPVFSGGDSKGAFAADIGLFTIPVPEHIPNLRSGVSVKNIGRPDVGLYSDDIVPLETRVGFAYDIGEKDSDEMLITCAFDLSYREKDMNAHIGTEAWIMERMLGVRAGGNQKEFTGGFSVVYPVIKEKMDICFDYSLAWPLYINDSNGTHRLALGAKY